jgi:hypothetical protein
VGVRGGPQKSGEFGGRGIRGTQYGFLHKNGANALFLSCHAITREPVRRGFFHSLQLRSNLMTTASLKMSAS